MSSAGSPVRRALALAWLALAILLVAHNGWLWLVQRRAPETDMLALLPPDESDPAVSLAARKVSDAAQQQMIVLIGSGDWMQARRAAAAYRGVLDAHADLFAPDRSGSLSMDSSLGPWWRHRGALLTAADRAALRARAPVSWADAAMEQLSGPFSAGRIGAWQDDPFGLFQHWWRARAGETPVRPVDGVLQVAEGDMRYAVVPVTLAAGSFSISTQRAAIPVLDQARAAAITAAPDARILSAGVIFFAADAAARASAEMSIIGWGSLAGIILLMWLVFRSPLPIGLVVLSLVVGLLGSLSVTALLFGRIHIITLVFGASLIGVAQDYGALYLCHRVGDRSEPWATMRALVPPLAFAVVTTSIGYLGLALTPFPGMRQMAVFSAAGLSFAWITVVLWLPFLDRRATVVTAFAARVSGSIARWPAFALDARTMLAAAAALGIAGVGLARVRTDDDIRLLVNAPARLVDEQREVGRILRAPAPAQFYLVKGADPEAVLAAEEALRTRLDDLIAGGSITGYHAVSQWVPSNGQQARDAALVDQRLLAPAGALDRVAARLGEGRAWGSAARTRNAPPSAPLTVDDWLASELSAPLRNQWLGRVDGGWASVITLEGVNSANSGEARRRCGTRPRRGVGGPRSDPVRAPRALSPPDDVGGHRQLRVALARDVPPLWRAHMARARAHRHRRRAHGGGVRTARAAAAAHAHPRAPAHPGHGRRLRHLRRRALAVAPRARMARRVRLVCERAAIVRTPRPQRHAGAAFLRAHDVGRTYPGRADHSMLPRSGGVNRTFTRWTIC